MSLQFVPITTDRNEMEKYLTHEFCQEIFTVYEQYYPKIGYNVPWIGYFVTSGDNVVGVGGYKGAPVNNKIEIAYGTVPGNEGKGFATQICNSLTTMALEENPQLIVTARTLPHENASTSILRKNNYRLLGVVDDPDDGEVWEWEYVKS